MGFFADVADALNIVNEAALRVASYRFAAADLDAASDPTAVDDQHLVAYLSFYPALKKVLARQPWRSISKVGTLTYDNISDIAEYQYKYALPSDWIRPVGFWDGYNMVEPKDTLYSKWAVYGGYLYTNFPISSASYVYVPAFSGYVAATWNTFLASFPPALRECMVLQLACDICYPLKRDLNRQTNLFQQLEIAITMAHEQDSASRRARQKPDGGMVEARIY